MSKAPILVGGKQIGRFRASWLLFRESLRFLQKDKELMFVPLVTGILSFILLAIYSVLVVGIFLHGSVPQTDAEWDAIAGGWQGYAFIFGVYIIGAFTLALSQAAIAHTVYERLHGRNATLGNALGTAFSHAFSLFIWAVITSTVGLVLRMIAERSRLLGAIVAAVLGVAWSVLTYFVVPAIVIDKKPVFSAISRSASVFRKTWGETLISNVSLGLVFLGAILLSIAVLILLCTAAFYTLPETGAVTAFSVLIILFLVWGFFLSLFQATLNGILLTLLYVYASENETPSDFNRELLGQMLARKEGSVVAPPPPVPVSGSVV